MEIKEFEINNERTAINISVSEIENAIESAVIYDKNTYGTDEGLDITEQLIPDINLSTEITLSDLQIGSFDGIYILVIKTDIGKIYRATELDTTKYDECIIDKILEQKNCDSCLKDINNSVINSFNLVYSLNKAERRGFINEILNIIKMLDKYCSNKCKTCGPYNNIEIDNNE